jgi:3-deoxy-D-manno-octulosonate 8-phosphate phosphatase (KDO 8-P phosphatase)
VIEHSARILTLASRIRLAIFDVDGVLTDGRLVLGPDGQEFKNFHVRDGHGLVMLRDSGIVLAIITGRESPVVAERMAQLGIEHVFQGQTDKSATLDLLLAELEIDPTAICYVGDDLPDIPIMIRVGLPIAVADAHWRLHDHAAYVTTVSGGAGAVREVCELILTAQDKLDAQIARFESRSQHLVDDD